MAALGRFCKHGNLRLTCKQCKEETVEDAEVRAAKNRARGESREHATLTEPPLHYPWQKESFDAWVEAGRSGLVAISPGLPVGDLPYGVVAQFLNSSPSSNVLVACAPTERGDVEEKLRRMGLEPTGLIDHHFMEPRGEAQCIVADLEELQTVDLSSWGRFATTGLLVLLDADGVNQAFGHILIDAPFSSRFCLSRQPSAMDLLVSRPWVKAFGPLLYRYTELQARDVGMLPRVAYKLHVEMLRPDKRESTMEGPWEPTDIPTRIPQVQAGAFLRGKARDVAIERCDAQEGVVVVHEGADVPKAMMTVPFADLPREYEAKPSAWLLADPTQDAEVLLSIADVAWKTLEDVARLDDTVVLPVPADLCHVPPWDDRWRMAAIQLDRAAIGLLLAEDPADAVTPEDMETLLGVALALRGLPQDDLYNLTRVVSEAARAAHEGRAIPPEEVLAASRTYGGVAPALLVAAEGGPAALLQLAHPGFTPTTPDLPHPALYDARRHDWRKGAFQALAQATRQGDLVTAWGRYPELRFVFPSSLLLERATAYCKRHRLKGVLDDQDIKHIEDKTRIPEGDKTGAFEVLKEWSDALSLAEEFERKYLADMHARQPERERRREGMAIPGLLVRHSNRSNVTLEPQGARLPRTNISPGSEVAIAETGTRKELGRGLVSKMTNRHITIDFPDAAPHHYPKQVTVNLVFDAKVFEAYRAATLGAIRAMSASQPVDDGPDGLVRAALLGETAPPASMKQTVDIPGLTPTQKEAIEATLSGGRVRLVHGPPGTGKTHTLVHLGMALSRAGHSVLVTADSNAAVDNMVVGLRRAGALVVRIGHAPNIRDPQAEPARIDPIEAPPFVRWAAGQGIVVATTNYGAFRYLDKPGSSNPFIFDYVIHDEAGQSTAPSSLAAVMRGRRLVLAGDPLQLPPTVVSLDAKEAGLDVTLFERIQDLTGQDRTDLIATQFRMREDIVKFSNKRYYDGKIETAPSAAEQAGLSEVPPLAFQHVTGREGARQKNGSISNHAELKAVEDLVGQFAPEIREKGWTFAVLTPYQAQREKLRQVMPDVEVSTVDGAQGREWDVVFYSSVRSNPKHRIGFLSDERRLNVAVTRARRNFILIGDERTLRAGEGLNDLLDAAEKIRRHWPDPTKKPGGAPGGKGGRGPKGGKGGRGPKGQKGKGKQGRGKPGKGKHGKGRHGGRGDGGDGQGSQNKGRGRRGGRRGRGDRPDKDGEGRPDQDTEGGGHRGGKGGRQDGGRPEADRRSGRGERPARDQGRGKAPHGEKAPGQGRRPDAGGGKQEHPAKGARDGADKPAPAGRKARSTDKGDAAAGKKPARKQCSATTKTGSRCKLPAKPGSDRCARHQ